MKRLLKNISIANFTIQLFVFCSISANAQVTYSANNKLESKTYKQDSVIYYNQNWIKCEKTDAAYYRVFKFMADSFPQKPICIDLKGWVPCSVNSVDIEGMLRREGELIIQLAQKYGLAKNLLIETETASILDYLLSKNSGAGVYLTAYGDFKPKTFKWGCYLFHLFN